MSSHQTLYNGCTIFNLSFQIHKFNGCQYVEYYCNLHACNVLKIDVVFFQMISCPPGRYFDIPELKLPFLFLIIIYK